MVEIFNDKKVNDIVDSLDCILFVGDRLNDDKQERDKLRKMIKRWCNELDRKDIIDEEYEENTILGINANYISSNDIKIQDNSINNGGSTDYYKFKENWKECQDIIEDRKLNFSQGNIFKSAFCFNIGRHSATDYERELNKIIYFANRELERIKREIL